MTDVVQAVELTTMFSSIVIVGALTCCALLYSVYDLTVWCGLVCFYGTSTIVGYLKPNSIFTYSVTWI